MENLKDFTGNALEFQRSKTLQIRAGVAPDSQNRSDDKEEMSRTLHLVQTKQHPTPAPPQTPARGVCI